MHRSRALLTVKMHLGIHQTSFGNTKDFDHADSAVKLILLLSEQQTGPKSPGMPKTWLGNSKTFVPTPMCFAKLALAHLILPKDRR